MMSPEVLITRDRDGLRRDAVGGRQPRPHLVGLPQRQRAAAGADAQKRCGGGLRHGDPVMLLADDNVVDSVTTLFV